ncbi:MAG: hypothetical protein ACI35W_05110 [Anaeroplasmataceae bacterium]
MSQNQTNLKNILEQITYLNSYEFTILASIIGLILCPKGLAPAKKQAIGNFFMLIAQTIVTLSSQELAQQQNVSYDDIDYLKSLIKNNIKNIDDIIDYINKL